MNRSLIAVALFYAAGILLGKWLQPSLAALFLISFFLLVLTLALKKFRRILIWPFLFFAGWSNLIFHTAVLSPDDLRNVVGNQAEIATARGVLLETPRVKIVKRDGQEIEHSLAPVKITELKRGQNWRPTSGKTIVFTPDVLDSNYFAGQKVEIFGVITRPPLPLADGLFNYRDYLQTRGIFYELKTESPDDWQLGWGEHPRKPSLQKPPLTDRFLNWSKRTLARDLPDNETLHLLWAMTLGWHTAFHDDIGDPYLRAGTMHLFAIDGLRIALISGILVALLRTLQISRAWCGAIAIPLIWFYTAATGWESSAIRASVMMTIVLGGWALKRPSDLLNSLAAAALVILICEPRQIFEASFQLSFCVMLVIALMLPPMNELTNRWLRHDPLLPDELLSGWQRIRFWLARKFVQYCSLSFAAWIGSIPLSIKYFHLFSPISTPANIIAVPLGTFALMADLGALICGNWFPFATELFNNAAWGFMSAMTWVSIESSKIPGAFFYVPEISWFAVGIYYLAVIAIFGGWLKTRPRKMIFAASLIFIAGFYFCQWQSSRRETDLTVLPLNGGHAIFMDAAGRKNDWLIDCGDKNAANFTLKQFLRAQGVNQIPRLVLTEGHIANVGGALKLNELFGVRDLWTSPAHFRSGAYNKIVATFENSSRHKIFNGDNTNSCWKILWSMATNDFPRADDNALVMLGNFSGAKILLLSDLSRAGQNALLSQTNDLCADIVVAGLPRQSEPLSNALLDAIHPRVIVIADSKFPATRRASADLKTRLARTKIPVIYTRDSGAVKIVADKSGWKLKTADGQKLDSTKFNFVSSAK